ncbi:endonuclease III domain-containing protein [Spiribacter vilamensis]|uniref:DNA-3-methyladenine glycosylase III n=1 Tax=Spiribacter vilamensis TaxID=531306 RepID=A0A4Q8D0T2_9GAMM|nr:endonuclease [Spiribacter vilamensis]RZU98830.1 DNA-3-methyladenine glycosylase III [Spiribacter vilamensis]TVO62151.1 endonuclease [Spiribacter vilamensis]
MAIEHGELPGLLDRLSEAFGPQDWWPAETAFEVLVGAVLTQNAAWRNVEQAIARLRARDWLSATAIVNAPADALRECIRPSGYYNVKAQRLTAACETWLELGGEAGLQAMETGAAREALLAVKGLGPESVDDVLLYGFNRPVFVVDAYTRRIFSRVGVVPPDIGYEPLQSAFHAALPRDARRFNEAHALIVALGKDYCRPRSPHCEWCPLQPACAYGGAGVQRS